MTKTGIEATALSKVEILNSKDKVIKVAYFETTKEGLDFICDCYLTYDIFSGWDYREYQRDSVNSSWKEYKQEE